MLIISRAWRPLIANALSFADELVRGGVQKIAKAEFALADKAGLEELLRQKRGGFRSGGSQGRGEGRQGGPAPAGIPGIEVMDIEAAVQVLWAKDIYAESLWAAPARWCWSAMPTRSGQDLLRRPATSAEALTEAAVFCYNGSTSAKTQEGPCGIRSLWRWSLLGISSMLCLELMKKVGRRLEEQQKKRTKKGVTAPRSAQPPGCLSALFLTGETVDDTIYIMSELFPTAKGGAFGQEKKWEQENVLRLVKKSRKGRPAVVFSRFGLMALLLILELVLLWMMWRWFNNDFEWFAAVQGVFTVLMFFHLFNSGTPRGSADGCSCWR